MKLTTNSRYGLRALVDLVANYHGTPVALCAIAARQCISESYLEQAFATLRKAGFVRSARGAFGGYYPAVDPAKTTAATVVRVLEGSLRIIDHGALQNDDPIKRSIRTLLWEPMDAAIVSTLDITLDQLAREYLRMRGDAQNNKQAGL